MASTAATARRAPQATMVGLDRLLAHPRNIRRSLGDLRDLIRSIAEDGVLVPVMAERRGETFRLLHGHRRAAAARQAGLRRIPCVVVDQHDDADAIALMLSENEQRLGLTPAERRDAISALRAEKWTVPQIARRIGVSEPTVYRWARGEEDLDLTAQPQEARKVAPQVRGPVLHDFLVRWSGKAPEPLLREVREWLKGWQPEDGS